MAFVLGLVTIFAAGAASAQSNLKFEAPFEFHVGKAKLAAGKYQLQKMSYGKFLLRSVETNEARIIAFDISMNNGALADQERLVFNRYGDTYFLRGVYDRVGADGVQLVVSSYEKQVRKGTANRENQLAEEKAKPEKVSINLSK
jgi:hypothetical protein